MFSSPIASDCWIHSTRSLTHSRVFQPARYDCTVCLYIYVFIYLYVDVQYISNIQYALLSFLLTFSCSIYCMMLFGSAVFAKPASKLNFVRMCIDYQSIYIYFFHISWLPQYPWGDKTRMTLAIVVTDQFREQSNMCT